LIYNKDATFPYPVLTNGTDSYEGGYFSLDIELNENNNDYRFKIDYEISSDFLNDLLNNEKAQLVLIIQSKDNKFYNLNHPIEPISISKTRISLSKRTSIQLLIKANEDIRFNNNSDLISFYDDIRTELIVPAHSVLGLSNVVIFDGSSKKPFELFEKKLDPTIKSDISIELGEETIIINYRSEAFQFLTFPNSTVLNYPYIYMGLQKALYKMIVENSDDNESLFIDDIEPPTNGLSFKLYNLMKSKFVDEININNLDEVICKISDRILEKFSLEIKGIVDNGN
jgi:hypothetical protein